MADELSDRQKAVLDLVVEYARDGWSFPSIREIGLALDINSTNGVADHLKALARKGWIEQRTRAQARNSRLTNKARIYYRLPTVPLCPLERAA